MQEQLISFETAKLAKEKEFKEECYQHYLVMVDNTVVLSDNEAGYQECPSIEQFLHSYTRNNEYLAPTQSLLQRWLREKHGVHIVIIPTVTSHWTYKTVRVISEIDNDVILGIKSVDSLPPYKEVCGYDFSTYEEALEDAFKKILKQINI